MLNFFRKHQKIFFIFVSFFIILSFSFFGTFSTFMDKEEVSNKEMGRIIDGSMLKERELLSLMGMLKGGIEEGVSFPNLLSDSFLHKEVILSGLGEVFARQYFSDLKPDLEIRWKQMKQYHPYMHPHASYINATAIWSQFAPEINTLLQQLQEAPGELSEDHLSLIFALYHAQAKFPPHMLYQMLYYQQRQNNQIPFDPALNHLNPALFGFQSIEDWFGPKFIELIAQGIINTACLAKTQGYIVTKEQARVSLMRNVYKGLEMYQGKKPKIEDVQNQYAKQISHLGLEENQAITLWQKVLSFQCLLEEIGEAAFVDSLALNQFASFADSKWKVRLFSLPKNLQFQDFRTLLKFQCYLEAVANLDAKDLLCMPNTFKNIESIANAYPQLVCKSFEVEMASLDPQEISQKISLKRTWEWEKNEENFELLQKQFPILATKNVTSDETRLTVLDQLDPHIRLKIDQFARKFILTKDPQWVKKALSTAEFKKQNLKVRLKKSDKTPFSGEVFLQMIEEENPLLQEFSVKDIVYSLRVLSKGEKVEVVTFAEALEEGALDVLLDERLKRTYEELKLDTPFEESQDEISRITFCELLSSLEKSMGKTCENLDTYVQGRFYEYLKQVRDASLENGQFFETFPEECRLQVEEVFLEKLDRKSVV